MSPFGAAIFSILLISGIMTAGNVHSKYGIPLWLWGTANGALIVLFAVSEIRAFIKRRKESDQEKNPDA